MADVNSIVKNLRLLVKGKEYLNYLILCTVVSVDGNTCVCQPIDEGEAEIPDVRLAGEASDTNFLLIPKVDSIVGVLAFSDVETTEYMVVLTSEVETVLLRGDQYGGVVKVEELTEKLNNLENKVNAIITAYNAHSHPANGSPTASTITGSLTPTDQSEIENENVKHG